MGRCALAVEKPTHRRPLFEAVADSSQACSPNPTRRLVLQRAPGGGVAILYPHDANAFSLPLAVVPLDPFQELPNIAVGDPVELSGPEVPGASVMIRCRDGVTIAPSSPLQRPGDYASRLFAERDRTVIAHPGAVGSGPPWRQAQSRSPSTVAEWEAWLRQRHLGAAVSVVGGVVFLIAAGVIVAVSGGIRFVTIGLLMLGTGAAGLAQAGLSRRALQAARTARDLPPRRVMVRLWWSIGTGSGPTAIASIAPQDARDPSAEAVHLAVLNTPPGLFLPSWIDAEILGEATEGSCPIIRVDGNELWPAETARRVLRRAWWHRWVDD